MSVCVLRCSFLSITSYIYTLLTLRIHPFFKLFINSLYLFFLFSKNRAWADAEKAEEKRVENEEEIRRATVELQIHQRIQDEESRRISQMANIPPQPTEGDMFDKYEYQVCMWTYVWTIMCILYMI